jgi:ubiquinone/menaquinone biosynthesis C-methylase UbiE
LHSVAGAFRGVAELYERARPGYPAEAVDHIVARLGLAPGRTAVDVAAGTGKLTRLLAASGARVIAVEPLAEMREVLERTAPSAEVLDGTAESLPLEDASADAVTVAQAFHWFDAEAALAEIARVVRPGGAAALVWNVRDLGDPIQARFHALLLPYRGETPNEHERPWLAAVAASPRFGPIEEFSVPWTAHYTRADLAGRFGSVSFVANLPEDERERLLARIDAEAAELDEPMEFRYRTDVYVLPVS